MHALIHAGKLVQVAADKFPVHDALVWVDCPDDVAVETHLYDNGGFIVKPPYVPTAAEINAPILKTLAANDAKIIRAITEGDTARIDAHKATQAALRAQLV